jgi:hypothetical protein
LSRLLFYQKDENTITTRETMEGKNLWEGNWRDQKLLSMGMAKPEGR